MASFAKLNSENKVIQVVSVHNNELLDNGVESEEKGIEFLKKLYNEPNAIYNTVGGIHLLGKAPFRKNHASVDGYYDENKDAFIQKKPFNSWILNENTCIWESPVALPSDWKDKIYNWDEETLSWKE